MEYPDIPGRPRSSAGFTQFGKVVYWAAGHLGQYHYYDKCHFSREFHCLDLESATWTRLADFPVPAQGFRMCGYDGGIFAFGGFIYEGDGEWPVRSTSTVRRYDIATDKWEDIAALSRPRSSNVLGQVGTLVYLIGGWDGHSKPDADESKEWLSMPDMFHDTIEVFDLSSLSTVDTFPLGISQRRALAASTSEQDITVACGLGSGRFPDLKSELMTLSTSSRTWTSVFSMPQGLFAPGLAWPEHSPLIVGGLYIAPDFSYFEEFATIRTFDPHAGGGWKERKLSSSRSFAETAVWNDQLLVLGGHSGLFPVSTVETFDLATLWDKSGHQITTFMARGNVA